MRNIHDLTRPLSPGLVFFPGDPAPVFSTRQVGGYLITDLQLTSHSGTHIDAPSHYLPGSGTIDMVSLDHLVGPCRVIETESMHEITPRDIRCPLSTERLLVRTAWNPGAGPEFPFIGQELAEYLASAGIRTLGIDTPSVEPIGGDGKTHRTLLSAGITLIELLDLTQVTPGDYYLVALPLPLSGLDGSPARVILIETDPQGVPS